MVLLRNNTMWGGVMRGPPVLTEKTNFGCHHGNVYILYYVFSKNWITFSCRGSFDQRSKHQNFLCCHFYKDDKSNSVLEEDHKCGLKIRKKVQFMDAELFFVCPKWFCLDQLLRVLMGEEIVIFYTEILTGKVELWCFFSSETSEKIHNSTFLVKISV